MNLEIGSRNKITAAEKHILVHDIPEEVTLGELRSYFSIYAGPDEEMISFAKVEVIPTEECHG